MDDNVSALSRYMSNFRTLTAVNSLFFVAIGISAPLMTLYLASLGASYSKISLILTSYVAVLIASNYLWGRVSDRLGRRKPILLIGLLGLTIGFFLLSRAPTTGFAWAARFIEAMGMAAFTTVSLAYMGDILEGSGQKGRRMGLYRGIGSLAFAAGALIGGRIADAYSLSLTFAVCSGVFLVALLVALALGEQGAQVAKPSDKDAADKAPTTKTKIKGDLPYFFLAGVLLWTAAHSASTSMWPNYMATLGYSKTDIGTLWGLAAFSEMPAMYLAGMLSDVMGRALLLAAGGFAIAIVQLGYLLVAAYLPALLGVQVIRGFGFGSYTATAMTFTAEQGEQASRGSNSGLFYMTASVGQLMGMFLGGQLVQFLGFSALYSVCFLFATSSAFCFLALRRYTTGQQNIQPQMGTDGVG
jgi:DHA1 family multidrug resistance protein-like MFS transporter